MIDGSGLVVAPGFIDMHTHADRTLLVDPAAENCKDYSPAPACGAVEIRRHGETAKRRG
ncbi:MAG: hypothetical protein AB7P40_23910 [Chloroflexota bacterium]